MLCYVMLCYVVLYYIILYYVILYYIILHSIIIRKAIVVVTDGDPNDLEEAEAVAAVLRQDGVALHFVQVATL